jgi:hypothetical protein
LLQNLIKFGTWQKIRVEAFQNVRNGGKIKVQSFQLIVYGLALRKRRTQRARANNSPIISAACLNCFFGPWPKSLQNKTREKVVEAEEKRLSLAKFGSSSRAADELLSR